MRQRAIIHHGVTSPEEMAEIYGIPVSRVKTLERLLLRLDKNRATKTGIAEKNMIRGKNGKKRSAKKTE